MIFAVRDYTLLELYKAYNILFTPNQNLDQ